MEGSLNGLYGKDWTVMVKSINTLTLFLSLSHTHPTYTQIIFLLLCAELKIPSEQCIKGDKFRFD